MADLGINVQARSSALPTNVSLGTNVSTFNPSTNAAGMKASALAALSSTYRDQVAILAKRQARIDEEEARKGAAMGADPTASIDDIKTRQAQDAFLKIRGRLWAEKQAASIMSGEAGDTAEQARQIANGLSKSELADTPFIDGAVPTVLGAISASQERDAAEARKAVAEEKFQSQLSYMDLMVKEALSGAAQGDIKKISDTYANTYQTLKATGMRGQAFNTAMSESILAAAGMAKTKEERSAILKAWYSQRPNGIPSIADSIPGGQLIGAQLQTAIERQDEQDDARIRRADALIGNQIEADLAAKMVGGQFTLADGFSLDDFTGDYPDLANLSDTGKNELFLKLNSIKDNIKNRGLAQVARDQQTKYQDLVRSMENGYVPSSDQIAALGDQLAPGDRSRFVELVSAKASPQVQAFLSNEMNTPEIMSFITAYDKVHPEMDLLNTLKNGQGSPEFRQFMGRLYNDTALSLERQGMLGNFTKIQTEPLKPGDANYPAVHKAIIDSLGKTLGTPITDINKTTEQMMRIAETPSNLSEFQAKAVVYRPVEAFADPALSKDINGYMKDAAERFPDNIAGGADFFASKFPPTLEFREYAKKIYANNQALRLAQQNTTAMQSVLDKVKSGERDIQSVQYTHRPKAVGLFDTYIPEGYPEISEVLRPRLVPTPEGGELNRFITVAGVSQRTGTIETRTLTYEQGVHFLLQNGGAQSVDSGKETPLLHGILTQAYDVVHGANFDDYRRALVDGKTDESTLTKILRDAFGSQISRPKIAPVADERFLGIFRQYLADKYFIPDDKNKTYVINPNHPYWKNIGIVSTQ